MSELKEGDKVHIETEVTAVHPDWVAVRLQFGRSVQNIRVDKAMVRKAKRESVPDIAPAPVEPAPPASEPLTPAQVEALDLDKDGNAGGAPKGGNKRKPK